jgi:hypothetical protein
MEIASCLKERDWLFFVRLKEKVIFGSLFTLALTGIVIASVTFAWVKDYPTYSNLVIMTGDYPLIIESDVFVRDFSDSENPGKLGSTQGSDWNTKTVEKNKPVMNGTVVESSSGTVTINFPSLSARLFDYLDYLLDEENYYTLKDKYFYFGFIEFKYIKQYFTGYLQGTMKFTTSVTNMEGLDSGFLKYNEVDDGTNKDRTDFINNDSDDSVALSAMTALITPTTLNTINSGSTVEMFPGYTPVSSSSSTNQIKVESNARLENDEVCYAYANAYSLYIDPFILVDFYKDIATINYTSGSEIPSFSLACEFNFTLSDTEIVA